MVWRSGGGYWHAVVEPGGAREAFGRLRVANAITLFDGKTLYDKQPLHFVEKFATGGTSAFVTNGAAVRLSVDGTANARVVRQTNCYYPYQAGKGHQAMMTFVFGSAVSGVFKRVGYFDDYDGFYLELSSSGVRIVRRSYVTGSVVNTEIEQADWNLDKLDGTGGSGFTLDPTKAQILFIDLEWLGTGEAICGFVIDGLFIPAHAFHHANRLSSVYIRKAALPIRWEILAGASSTSTASMDTVCCTVASEGGSDWPGIVRAVDTGITAKAISTTLTPLIQIRAKSDFVRSTIIPTDIGVYSTLAGANFRWALIRNPTVTGGVAASWSDWSTSSHVQYDVAATGEVTAGTLVQSGYSDGRSEVQHHEKGVLCLGADVDGTGDVYTLAVQRVSGGNADFYGAIHIREIT